MVKARAARVQGLTRARTGFAQDGVKLVVKRQPLRRVDHGERTRHSIHRRWIDIGVLA